MARMRIGRAFVFVGAAALACLAGSCTEKTPCDEGQVLTQGMCYPAQPDAAVAPSADAYVETEAGGTSSAFGKTCATSAECVAPADYCATPPGNCTATGCELDPSICPLTWTCFDLTPFGNPVNICIPPM